MEAEKARFFPQTERIEVSSKTPLKVGQFLDNDKLVIRVLDRIGVFRKKTDCVVCLSYLSTRGEGFNCDKCIFSQGPANCELDKTIKEDAEII